MTRDNVRHRPGEAGYDAFTIEWLMGLPRRLTATRMADCGADAFRLAAIFGRSDLRMALRHDHATDEAKRRAVENLVKPVGPSDESVTNEKGRALPCL